MWPLLFLAEAHTPLSAEDCIDCHAGHGEDWMQSRHRISWSNELFQEDFAAEPLPVCRDCHAPGPRPEEGVSCLTCHLEGSVILSPSVSGEAPHASRSAPELAESMFCAGCHDFNFALVHPDGSLTWSDEPMQSTFREWSRWPGTETCQDCHMTGGEHRFPGAHDVERLAGSVRVTALTDGAQTRLVVESVGVGHALPTGDLFRHMTLQIQRPGQPWIEAAWIGRRFGYRADAPQRTRLSDTRIFPDQPAMIIVPPGPLRWRLRYHYTEAEQPSVVLLTGGGAAP